MKKIDINNIRLLNDEKNALNNTLEKIDFKWKIYIFWSRTMLDKKWWDIDILLENDNKNIDKINMIAKFKDIFSEYSDTNIDVIIKSNHPFFEIIDKKLIYINQ